MPSPEQPYLWYALFSLLSWPLSIGYHLALAPQYSVLNLDPRAGKYRRRFQFDRHALADLALHLLMLVIGLHLIRHAMQGQLIAYLLVMAYAYLSLQHQVIGPLQRRLTPGGLGELYLWLHAIAAGALWCYVIVTIFYQWLYAPLLALGERSSFRWRCSTLWSPPSSWRFGEMRGCHDYSPA